MVFQKSHGPQQFSSAKQRGPDMGTDSLATSASKSAARGMAHPTGTHAGAGAIEEKNIETSSNQEQTRLWSF